MKTIYKMTREDKRCLNSGHPGRLVFHMSAEGGNTTISRFDTLHLAVAVFTPKDKDGLLKYGRQRIAYEVDDCGTFDCLSDTVFVLRETGRLSVYQSNCQEGK